MKDAKKAWMDYSAHFRGANVGGDFTEWTGTKNPFLMDLAGVAGYISAKTLNVKTLHGFEATFACGTRVDMHDLDIDFSSLQGSFKDCVKNGQATNKRLREQEPTMPFLPDEIVVRMTIKPLSGCEKAMPSSAPQADQVNPIYANFAKINGCTNVGPSLPADLQAAQGESTYRGMLLGSGIPKDTLLEVLVDPADFLEGVKL